MLFYEHLVELLFGIAVVGIVGIIVIAGMENW